MFNKKTVKNLLEIKVLKAECEVHLLNKDFTFPALEKLRMSLGKNRESQILASFAIYEPRMRQIIALLQKAKAKERYEKYQQEITQTLVLLQSLVDKKWLSRLQALVDTEAKAVQKKDYYGFLTAYQEEKALATEVVEAARESGLALPEEIIRSGFHDKNKFYGFYRYALQAVREKSVLATLRNYIILLLTFPYLPIILSAYGKYVPLAYASRKLSVYFKNLKERKIEYSQKTIAFAERIKRDYEINVLGNYLFHHLQTLFGMLQKYSPMEVKRFLKAVIFLEGRAEDYDEDYKGIYIPETKSVRVFIGYSNWSSTLAHEIAHARSWRLPRHWRRLWKKANKKGIDYFTAQKITREIGTDREWRFLTNGRNPAFGYAEPSGTTNLEEDIATFAERLESYIQIPPDIYYILGEVERRENLAFVLFLDIYAQKAKLLYKFGFVKKNACNGFLEELNAIQKIFNSKNRDRNSSPSLTEELESFRSRCPPSRQKIFDEVFAGKPLKLI